MTSLTKDHGEKMLLALTGVLLLLSGAWSWWRPTAISLPMPGENWNHEEYQPATLPGIRAAVVWEQPGAQSAGADWIFEVFGPPPILRDANTGKFTAETPGASRGVGPDSGIKLLAIRAAPYRVQLQGSYSEAGGEVAALAVVATREIWFARPGERRAALGVVLEKLDNGNFVRATLRDESTGQEVILTAGETTYTDMLLATFRLEGNSSTRTLREGDAWEEGEVTYRIDRLRLSPAEAEIVRIEPDRLTHATLLLQLDYRAAGGSGAARRGDAPAISLSSHNGP